MSKAIPSRGPGAIEWGVLGPWFALDSSRPTILHLHHLQHLPLPHPLRPALLAGKSTQSVMKDELQVAEDRGFLQKRFEPLVGPSEPDAPSSEPTPAGAAPPA